MDVGFHFDMHVLDYSDYALYPLLTELTQTESQQDTVRAAWQNWGSHSVHQAKHILNFRAKGSCTGTAELLP